MTSNASKPTTIHVDAGQWLGDLPHNWTYIGYDEIDYTYTPEGQALLRKFATFQEQPYYIRAHHLLCTGNCHGFYKWGSTNAYLEDDEGTRAFSTQGIDKAILNLFRMYAKMGDRGGLREQRRERSPGL